jgi:signal transduction histidine kinase
MANDALPHERLIRLISHDLRNPLTAVQLNAQLIEQSAIRGGREKEQRWASLIVSAARRLDSMLQQLGEAERIRSGRIQLDIEPLIFGPFLRELLQGAGVGLDIDRIQLTLPQETLELSADRIRLGKAMLNLLTLASQQTPPSSVVTLDARAGDSKITCTISAPLPPEATSENARERLSAAEGRTGMCDGIALHLARSLIESHGGELRVDAGDRALVFEIALPAVRK